MNIFNESDASGSIFYAPSHGSWGRNMKHHETHAQERGSGWIFQTGTNQDDEVHGMAQDSNGNIIVAGETQVEVDVS